MQKIVFVTGKGGVGKSVYAAALAAKYAQSGRLTLLVELGDQSFYQEFFSIPKVGYTPVAHSKKLEVAIWSGAECLKEYALHLLKSATLYKLFFENKVSKSLIQIAPGLPELAILGKITAGPRKHGPPAPHEVIVVDAFATGHFLALMRAPIGLSQAISFGPMGEQSRGIHATLIDSKICEFHIVSLAEELPYKESRELDRHLLQEFNIKSQWIFNKIIETTLTSFDLEKIDSDFVHFLRPQLREKENYLKQALEADLPFKTLPFIFDFNAESLHRQLVERIKL